MKFFNVKNLLILIFALGAAIRLADAFRPIDKASWRECDLGAISRNYVNEGMNPFYPRIDWRGESPGYAEMEFPLYPYLIALSYKLFGIFEFEGRLINFFLSLAAMGFFFLLAREYLQGIGLLFACAFFTFNPLFVEISTSIQPEGLMFMAYIASVFFFKKWIDADLKKYFFPALVFAALAMLGKLTAAHIGLLFAWMAWQRYGLGLIKKPKLWFFGFASLLPAAIWYSHAKNLWKTYGNSLGVSNEAHLIGWDFFTNPDFIGGILHLEFSYIWLGFGAIVGFYALWKGRGETLAGFSFAWLCAAFILYLIACRTAADDWAYYYHIFSLPPAALLFGLGAGNLYGLFQGYLDFSRKKSWAGKIPEAVLVLSIAACIMLTFLFSAKKAMAVFLDRRVKDNSLACAKKIMPLMKKSGAILVSGSRCFGGDGLPRAYNSSFMFYWLERKGSNICIEDQSIDKVADFAKNGARYFIAEKKALLEKPGFEKALREKYSAVYDCEEMILFDLEN